jgi:hypothetical protein
MAQATQPLLPRGRKGPAFSTARLFVQGALFVVAGKLKQVQGAR